MTELKSFKPLLAVGMQYVKDIIRELSNDDMDLIQKTLSSYLENKISREETINVYRRFIGTTLPFDKVESILNVKEEPLSTESENQYHVSGYYNNLIRKKTHPWNEMEDQRLIAGIHKYGLDNWASIASFVGNSRTRAQCSQRWFRGLDPRIAKVLWTQREDEKLMQLISKYGDKSWTKISTEIGNRSDAQCRYRYRQLSKEQMDDRDNSQTYSLNNFLNSESQKILTTPTIVLPSIYSFLNNNNSSMTQCSTKLKKTHSLIIRSSSPKQRNDRFTSEIEDKNEKNI